MHLNIERISKCETISNPLVELNEGESSQSMRFREILFLLLLFIEICNKKKSVRALVVVPNTHMITI